jgi:biofilm protein TabA
MICDTLTNNWTYRKLSPRVAKGLAWLERFSPATPDGRYEVDGDGTYALVQSYDTVNASDRKFESHRRYLDIQYVATGHEVTYYAPIAGLDVVQAYDEGKDFALYAEPATATPLTLTDGTFAIFYPQDGHKPGCSNGGVRQIKKVVVKVPLD